MSTITSALGRSLELFSALRYRDFRLFWIGLVAQVMGRQMMMVTVGWLTYDLTGSALKLGIVTLLQGIPAILLNLVGGALADRVDRRLLIIVAQTLSTAILVALAVLTITDRIEVEHLYASAFLIGLIQAFDEPSRASLFPHLLPNRAMLPQAVPLFSMAWQFNRIVAPSIAGFVIASMGAGVSFFLAAVGAAVMVMVMPLLRVGHIPTGGSTGMLSDILEGARYVWSHMVFRMVIGMAFVNSIFALGYIMMLPVFAVEVYHVDARGLGLMYSVPGVGSIVALFTVRRLIHIFPPGRVIVVGLGLFSASLVAFALSPSYPVALGVLLVVGYATHLFLASSEIVLQVLVPDGLRGRVMGLHGTLWGLLPLGAFLLNTTAHLTSARVALTAGASLVLLFVLLVAARSGALKALRLDDQQIATPKKAGQAPAG